MDRLKKYSLCQTHNLVRIFTDALTRCQKYLRYAMLKLYNLIGPYNYSALI